MLRVRKAGQVDPNALKKAPHLMEPEAGIGPATYALRVRCSTTELPGRELINYRNSGGVLFGLD